MESIIGGAISPGWVLSGIIGVFTVVLWRMLTTMQNEIKENTVQLGKHQTKIEVHEERLNTIDENIGEQNSKLAEEIVAKIRLLNQL